MSDSTPEPTYAQEAAIQDQLLDEKIARIRAQLELGTITVREAADLRVAAYSHHLLAIADLNRQYFGG
jgi:hypothetical protein